MRTLLAVVVVALVAGSIWWLCSPDPFAQPPLPDTSPAAPQQTPAAVVAPAEAPLPTESAASAPAAAEKTERTAVTAPDRTRPEHTLRGRAVDASGQPLPGISARLLSSGNRQKLAEWTKSNPEPERIDLTVTTEADGVFTFRCWPPPPFQFFLRLQSSGFATWSQRWPEWAPGGTTDLGDVKLERGTLLRGRVVDSTGVPVAKVDVRVSGGARGDPRAGSFESSGSARTGDDGAFVQRSPLLAGEYTISIRDQQIERGEKVTLTGEPEQFVEVVLKYIDPAESISGVVVDDAGAPIRGAMVHALHGAGRTSTTDAQGRFRVLKRDEVAAEVVLSVVMDGYERPPEGEKIAWGRHDVRLVMTRGKELVVLAVSAADGTPVENYVLRVMQSGANWFSSRDREPRGKPPHKDGRATVRGITAGKHRVVVEPQGGELAIGVVPIEVGSNGAPPVTVRLAATQPRIVRVVFADGAPVAGAKVQLVDAGGEPWNDKMPVYSLTSQVFTPSAHALELAAATTGASGECTLPVPGDRPLALMLPGPGHTALAVQQAVFPAEGPLVVTVSSGATLRGQLGPEAAWAELKRLAGHEGAARPGQLPSIMLHRGEGRAREQFPDFRSHQTVKPDGSFELTGIPPGQWNVLISYFTSQGGQGGHGSFGKQEPAGTVDLVDGQVTTIAPDLSGLLPGTLEALVMHDGAPLANTLVNLGRLVPGAQWPQPEDALTTDGEGRLRASLRAGEYRASWFAQHGNGSSSMLPSLETAIVRVGETTQQRFTIVSGTVKVRLVDSSGAPVANVQIMLANVAGESTEGLGATGADGRIEKRFTPGTFTASVMPKRLQDQKALMEFYRTATDPAAMLRAFVTVGTITVRAGETHEVELRLPADW